MVSGEKRNSEEERKVEKVTAILLDIEGTTTSISFVKDKLFPYAREQLSSYIDSHQDNDEFKAVLVALKEQAKKDLDDNVEGAVQIEDGEKEKETLIKNVLWQMDLDRKTTALKQLQGYIWKDGYKAGHLKGHLYDEVAACLKKWSEDGRLLYVYSSGSVDAQKLLFGNTEEGNLLPLISGHFDTTVGPKLETASYASIASSIGCECDQILFLTDVVKEAKAAKTAGLQTIIVIREGNVPLTDEEKQEFLTVGNFQDLVFESSAKKKKFSEEEKQEIEETGKVASEKEIEKKEPHRNGVAESEKMEVETTCENGKPEITEPKESADKTETKPATEEKKTADDVPEVAKTTTKKQPESEDTEIDILTDDRKEEAKTEEKQDETKTKEVVKSVTEKETSEKKVETSDKVEKDVDAKEESTPEAKESDKKDKKEDVASIAEVKDEAATKVESEKKEKVETETKEKMETETKEKVETETKGETETKPETVVAVEGKKEDGEKIVNGAADTPEAEKTKKEVVENNVPVVDNKAESSPATTDVSSKKEEASVENKTTPENTKTSESTESTVVPPAKTVEVEDKEKDITGKVTNGGEKIKNGGGEEEEEVEAVEKVAVKKIEEPVDTTVEVTA